jgi:imidazolonepropionase-like amidohydrolase
MLSRAGLTNRQVLAAATNNFSLLWNWKHIGKIEAGRDADILVLTGDPTKSIENLKKIDVLMVKGRLVDRKELLIIKL